MTPELASLLCEVILHGKGGERQINSKADGTVVFSKGPKNATTRHTHKTTDINRLLSLVEYRD
jgi:hypothetical protein